MKTGWRFQFVRPTWSQVMVSLLIAVGGLVGSHVLQEIDRDLRIMYVDYTLAATDLGHISADVMRYRATIIRAIEALTQRDFERISASLPEQRARILALDRLVEIAAEVARILQEEGRRAIRMASAALIVGSLLIALLVLFSQQLPLPPSLEPRSAFREPDRFESPSFLNPAEEDHAEKFSARKS